jgi:hypothetical protein
MRGISGLAKELFASQEVLCSMDLVSQSASQPVSQSDDNIQRTSAKR